VGGADVSDIQLTEKELKLVQLSRDVEALEKDFLAARDAAARACATYVLAAYRRRFALQTKAKTLGLPEPRIMYSDPLHNSSATEKQCWDVLIRTTGDLDPRLDGQFVDYFVKTYGSKPDPWVIRASDRDQFLPPHMKPPPQVPQPWGKPPK
jgi:hypothetical protein